MDRYYTTLKLAILSITLLFVISSCYVNGNLNNGHGSGINPTNAEPGACYAKSKILQSTTIEALVYTGIDTDAPTVQLVTDIISPAGGTKWVKKKADKNCRSRDPNDCLVWCLEKTPEETVSYYTVIDTTINKEFEYLNLIADNIEPSYVNEWRRVVCADRMNRVIDEVQFYLLDYGFDISTPLTGKMDEETKTALWQFQKDHNLPIGSLNYETLSFMDITTP